MPAIASPCHSFEFTVPVAIVGGGACGLAAALAARDAGTEVIALERDRSRRGSKAMSLGAICAVRTQAQAAKGVADDPESISDDAMAKTAERGGRPRQREWRALRARDGEHFGNVHSGAGARRSAQPDRLGRSWQSLAPLEAPCRALKTTGALFHTQGGLAVDEHARVLRPDGTPLPNLFAGGGTARGISGPEITGYLAAMGPCMALTLGRLAGDAAARLAGDAAARGPTHAGRP